VGEDRDPQSTPETEENREKDPLIPNDGMNGAPANLQRRTEADLVDGGDDRIEFYSCFINFPSPA